MGTSRYEKKLQGLDQDDKKIITTNKKYLSQFQDLGCCATEDGIIACVNRDGNLELSANYQVVDNEDAVRLARWILENFDSEE